MNTLLSHYVDGQRELDGCIKFLNHENWTMMPASIKYHHNWLGGMAVHTCETMCVAIHLLKSFPNMYDISESDLIIAAFMHDADKVTRRYEIDPEKPTDKQKLFAKSLGIIVDESIESKSSLSSKIDMMQTHGVVDPDNVMYFRWAEDNLPQETGALVCSICAQYGIPVNDQIMHAISFHEGGWNPYIKQHAARMTPISTLLHCADMTSVYNMDGNVDLSSLRAMAGI